MSQKHDPSRFTFYNVSPDGQGFFIPTGEYFPYNEDGGWTDEFGNRYTAEGAPDLPRGEPAPKPEADAYTKKGPGTHAPAPKTEPEPRDDSDISWDRSSEEYEDEEEAEFDKQAEVLEKIERKKEKQKNILHELDESLSSRKLIRINAFNVKKAAIEKVLAGLKPPIVPSAVEEYEEEKLVSLVVKREEVEGLIRLENSGEGGLEASFYLDEDQD